MRKILLFLLIPSFSVTLNAQEVSSDLVKIGDVVPSFSIQTIDGVTFDISKLRGKVVYINFFATWCGPCIKELPYVEKDIWKGVKNENFAMLVIGREHTNEELIKFRTEKGYTFPIAADTKRSVYSLFATQTIPRNVVVDKNGKIIYFSQGFSEEEFKKMAALIKESL